MRGMGLKCGDRPTVDARAQGRLTEQVPKVRPSHESSPLERVLGSLRTDRKTRGGHSECGPQDQASLTLPSHPPPQSIFVDPFSSTEQEETFSGNKSLICLETGSQNKGRNCLQIFLLEFH